jgi:hypothetical protein
VSVEPAVGGKRQSEFGDLVGGLVGHQIVDDAVRLLTWMRSKRTRTEGSWGRSSSCIPAA